MAETPTADDDEPVNYKLYEAGADLAYPLAIDAYRESERRLDVVEKRIHDLMAFAISITLAVITFTNGKADPHSWIFVTAMVLWCGCMATGLFSRLSGRLRLVSPAILYSDYLRMADAKFKVLFVGHAGENCNWNADQIARVANLTNVAAILFLFEIVLLGAWASQGPPAAPSPGSTATASPAVGAAVPVGLRRASPFIDHR